MTRFLLPALLMAALTLSGCYYTVTEKDGTTKRINKKEYEQLKSNPRNNTKIHVAEP